MALDKGFEGGFGDLLNIQYYIHLLIFNLKIYNIRYEKKLVFYFFCFIVEITKMIIQFFVEFLNFRLTCFFYRRKYMANEVNECGCRNGFGYYDCVVKEVVLKRPCKRKADLKEAYDWIDGDNEIRKISIGIGGVEKFVQENSSPALYVSAREVIKQNALKTAVIDAEILENILVRIEGREALRNLSMKCFLFADNENLFNLMIKTVKTLKNLVYLDFTGCYFTDEQLIDLADVVSSLHVAHLVWPEARMSPMVLEEVVKRLESNKAITVVRGAPLELGVIAAKNREWIFEIGRHPSRITDAEAVLLKEYINSVRIAIAFEKQKLFDIEKALEGAMA